MISMNIEIIYS